MIAIIAIPATPGPVFGAGKAKTMSVPDFTKGEKIPEGVKHDWNLGATGLRHFEPAVGTSFFWLGDTWWKCLCKRMIWEGFQELADRQAKGFDVVQIGCGPDLDEVFLEPRLVNEGGLPSESVKFAKVNPEYFDYAALRLTNGCWALLNSTESAYVRQAPVRNY